MKTSSALHVFPASLVASQIYLFCSFPMDGTHGWDIIFENFVRRTEEVAGQSVCQLKIFSSRLDMY